MLIQPLLIASISRPAAGEMIAKVIPHGATREEARMKIPAFAQWYITFQRCYPFCKFGVAAKDFSGSFKRQ